MAAQTSSDLSAAQPSNSFSFLTLAPTTSATYPSTQASSNSNSSAVKIRRSSSSASAASASSSGLRFLKLGPVHFGEGVDGEGDWSEVSIAE